VLPVPLPACCDVESLLLLVPLCCVLPEDEAELVLLPLPLLLLPSLLLLLLWLLLALLVLFVLLELWLFDGDGAGVGALAEDDGVGEGAGADAGVGVGAGAGALCAALFALCDASFCESMLCCKVCENGWVLTMSTGEFVCELPDEPNSELIYESGDMADPVYPVNRVKFRSMPVTRSSGQIQMILRSGTHPGYTPSARILRIRAACSSASRCSRRATCWASAASPRACRTS
jgi:hypothetical protein